MGGRSALRSASASDPLALLRLARPVNGLIAAGAVVVGAVVVRRPPEPWPVALGALAAFAAASGANALNDVVDRRADAINRPERPVASGAVGARAALTVALAGYAAALACAFGVSLPAGALAAAWVALTVLYSVTLKGVPVVSNALVALVAASPLVMGGISQGRAGPTMLPLALAFLAHFAREIVKDAEDLEGDTAAGVRTTAVAFGPRAAVAIARVVVVSLAGAAAVPFAVGLFGWGYAAGVVAIDVLLLLVLASTARPADRARLGRASSLLKWVMAVGLLAFVLGVVWR
jgi:geranylgeranylglycerol-phosphate geranylgeranyltransferase